MSANLMQLEVQASNFRVSLTKTPDNFAVSLTATNVGVGLDLIQLRLTSDKPALPGVYRLTWSQLLIDVHAFWRPGTDRSRTLPADWSDSFISQATTHAPTGCLFNLNGENRHTFAFSDALNPLEIKAGVNEETATFLFSLTLFQVSTPMTEYNAVLRLDTRPNPYYDSLREVQEWWESLPGYTPATVPMIAKQPMYSTWYSFHQKLVASEVEEECRLAKELGCEAVIVDDGWQTADNRRGYAFCGDWEVWAEKIPDMAAHVAKIHQLGLKFILWYALPFVGENSQSFNWFANQFLNFNETHNTWVLDPRFPAVREYLIQLCEKAIQEWDIDGFKLDFVQHFKQPIQENLTELNGRDFGSVPDATDHLLEEIITRLRRSKPDVLIEFRQPYIGPLMRKYGNMFRTGDCPNDSLNNRQRTLDVRLLSGNTAPHSDMLMWHPDDPVESAALQIINVLFAVPQISMRLAKLPPDHRRMLSFWLSFWQENRALLLQGQLKPFQPELGYLTVEALTDDSQLIAVYANVVANLTFPPRPKILIVNGTLKSGVVLDSNISPSRTYRQKIYNCEGDLLIDTTLQLETGLNRLLIPPSGLAILETDKVIL
jgi:alpha-galactosidase